MTQASEQAMYVNQTTQASDFNKTPDWYFDGTNSTYDLASSIPITGLAYTLFGFTCCFTVLGLSGNCLILISMFKFQSRSKSHGILIIALAIFDSIALISMALEQPCVHEVFGLDIRAITTIGCKISWAFLLPALACSTEVVVLICVERFLSVWFPLKARRLLSEKNVLKAIWVCLTPIVLIYIAMSVLYVEVKEGICSPNFEGSQYSTVLNRMPDTTIYNWSIGFFVVFFMLILSIFTPLTIVKLYKQKMVVRRRLKTSTPNAQLNATHFQLSVKLIAVVITQVTLIGLPAIVTIGFLITGTTIDEKTISALTLAILLNHSINFLLYNVFDADFRRNVFTLIGFANKDKDQHQNC